MKYAFTLCLLLAGCMVGPKYQEPEMAMPEQFEQAVGEEWEGSEDLCAWWKQFNDPLLDDLIAEAIHSNYDLRIAVERIEQARSQYRIERSHLWPEIDFNATATRTRISQNFLPKPAGLPPAAAAGGIFPRFLNIFQVGLDAIWELDIWGKYRHDKKAARYTWESMKDDAESVLISMVSEVAVAYVNIRAVQKKIDIAERKILTDELELEIAESLYEIGLDNELQITNLVSALETDRAALPVLKTSFKQTIYSLAYLLGREPEGLMAEFKESGPIPASEDKVPIGLPSDLLRRRPDIRSAERQLAAATEQIGVAVADLFPHLSLTGISFGAGNRGGSSYGFEGYKLNKVFKAPSQMISVGANINWDVLDFGRVRGKIDVQNSLQRQALLTYEQTVISSLKDVESALVAYFEEQDRKEVFRVKVAADSRTLEITQDLYEIGLSNETQVLEAEKNLLSSENSYVESEQALAGDLIALYKAIGGDWVSGM